MEDLDKTIAPRRTPAFEPEADLTMPGKRDRKPDGRFAVGDLIMNRYKVLSELGQGGMGVVYKCFDETAGIEVALKALPPELSHNTLEMEDVKDNFQLVSKLVHQNIAILRNLERDNSNGNYYLIMECCEGEDLRRWIKRKRREGKLTLEEILPIIRQIALALDYAHEMKVMHRDVKPGNIMIDQFGKIKVLDFGLAAQIQTSMSRVSHAYHGTSGTGPYMAPEQWRGRRQGAYSDQYSLAVMTYEMLAGNLPFESSDAAVLQQAVLTQEPEVIEGVPQNVQSAIFKAMSKESSDRYASCTDFVDAMCGNVIKQKTEPQQELQKTKSETPATPRPLKKYLLMALSILIGVAILLFSIQWYSDWKKEKDAEQSKTSVEKTKQTFTNAANETFTLPNGVKLEMVKVEPGEFIMSKDGDNILLELEHSKTLTKAFYIGKYEVTQEQYEAVMGNNPSESKGSNRPVEQVSWYEAMSFCEKMNQYAPNGWKFTLPTETQWEFAARGGNRSKGYKYSGSNNLDDVGWYYSNSGGTTHEVGGKTPNELGLYDMSGNVWEWCLDNLQSKSDATRAEFDRPYHDEDGSSRVGRGGSWGNIARYCRSAYRHYWEPGDRHDHLGFRLALVRVD